MADEQLSRKALEEAFNDVMNALDEFKRSGDRKLFKNWYERWSPMLDQIKNEEEEK